LKTPPWACVARWLRARTPSGEAFLLRSGPSGSTGGPFGCRERLRTPGGRNGRGASRRRIEHIGRLWPRLMMISAYSLQSHPFSEQLGFRGLVPFSLPPPRCRHRVAVPPACDSSMKDQARGCFSLARLNSRGPTAGADSDEHLNKFKPESEKRGHRPAGDSRPWQKRLAGSWRPQPKQKATGDLLLPTEVERSGCFKKVTTSSRSFWLSPRRRRHRI